MMKNQARRYRFKFLLSRVRDEQTAREKWLEDFPEVSAVGGEMATAAKIVNRAGKQVPGPAGISVEMSVERLAVSIDGDQNPISLKGTLKNKLLIGQKQSMIIAITERFAFPVGLGTGSDPLG